MRRLAFLALSVVVAWSSLPAASQAETAPRPDTYICPNSAGPGAVNCFLDAVEHLYTMCRQVKSIEIIEFGHEKSDEGVNGAKSAYCVDKHKASMAKPYQAALRESHASHGVTEQLRSLHAHWLESLQSLKWIPGESDDDYKARVARPYESFRERALAVRNAVAETIRNKADAVKKKFGRKPADDSAKPAKPSARLASAKDHAN